MPLAFPSHQGLIAPLWRRWPARFDMVALCVGAALPDVVDGVASPLVRGHLGQWLGHSLIGLPALCLPVGVAGLLVARRRLSAIVLGSLLLGAFSHLVFDLVTHDGFPWLYPWAAPRVLPAFWTATWFTLPVPFYAHGYPVGPHLVAWVALSGIGAWMFFSGRRSPRSGSDPSGDRDRSPA